MMNFARTAWTGIRLRKSAIIQSYSLQLWQIENFSSRNFFTSELCYASLKSPNYEVAYHESIEDPQIFWEKAASEISWFKKYTKVHESDSYPKSKLFPGGELNVCYNALDRHVNDRKGDQIAIIYDSPVTNTIKKISYSEALDLLDTVRTFPSNSISSLIE